MCPLKTIFVLIGLFLSPICMAQADGRPLEKTPQAFYDFSRSELAFNSEYNGVYLFDNPLYSAQLLRLRYTQFRVKHVEIPLDDPKLYTASSLNQWDESSHLGPSGLILNFARYLPPSIKDAFIFTKNGARYLRWVLHPLDTLYNKKVIHYLKQKGVQPVYGHYFSGLPLASRSFLLIDPKTKKAFSYKTSTNRTMMGNQAIDNRPLPIRWADLARQVSDYFYAMKPQLETLDIAWEAGMFGLPEIDSGSTIRLMEPLNNGVHHVSGFVLENKKGLDFLVEKSGLAPKELLKRLFLAQLKAMLEMNLILGVSFASAHGQNIRFEFDKNWQPTGRVILLDVTDLLPIQQVLERNGQHQLLSNWKNRVSDSNPIMDLSKLGAWPQFQFVNFSKLPESYSVLENEELARIANDVILDWTKNRPLDPLFKRLSIHWEGHNDRLHFRSSSRSFVDPQPQSQVQSSGQSQSACTRALL